MASIQPVKIEEKHLAVYIMPGMLLVLGLLFHAMYFGDIKNYDNLWSKTFLCKIQLYFDTPNAYSFSIIIIIFLFLTFLAGHFISSLSSIVFDKLLIERIEGYPYERLLKYDDEFPSTHSENPDNSDCKKEDHKIVTGISLLVVLIMLFLVNCKQHGTSSCLILNIWLSLFFFVLLEGCLSASFQALDLYKDQNNSKKKYTIMFTACGLDIILILLVIIKQWSMPRVLIIFSVIKFFLLIFLMSFIIAVRKDKKQSQGSFGRTHPSSFFDRQKKYLYKAAIAFLIPPIIYISYVDHPSNIQMFHIFLPGIVFIVIKVLFTAHKQKDICNPYTVKSAEKTLLIDTIWSHLLYAENIPRPMRFVGFPSKMYDLFSRSLLSLFRLSKPFHPEFRRAFRKRFFEIFDFSAEYYLKTQKSLDTDIFWLTYLYVITKNAKIANYIKDWLYSYELCRNIAMSFLFLAIYSVATNVALNAKISKEYLWWISLIYICALIFSVRYYYIYYNYFSKFIFRTFVAMDSNDNHEFNTNETIHSINMQ